MIKLAFGILFFAFGLVNAIAQNSSHCVDAGKSLREGIALSDASMKEEELYRDAITKCPTMPEAHYNLGVVLSKRGGLEQVTAKNIGATSQKLDEALESINKAIAIREDASFFSAKGALLVAKSDWNGARTTYQKAISLDPKSLKAYQGLGLIEERTNHLDLAEGHFRKGTELNAADAISWFNLGVVLERRGRSSESLKAYEKALFQDGQFFDAALSKGILLQQMDKIEESKPPLELAAKLRPEDPNPHRALGSAYEKEGDFDKAEIAFRKATSLDSADSLSWTNLGIILVRKKQEALAVDALQKAVDLDPKSLQAKSALGWALTELGRYKEAEAILTEAIAIDPSDKLAKQNMGILQKRMGK